MILSGGFLIRQPGPEPLGCGRYVPTQARFGKGCGASFPDFMTILFRARFGLHLRLETPVFGAGALARKSATAQPWHQPGGSGRNPWNSR